MWQSRWKLLNRYDLCDQNVSFWDLLHWAKNVWILDNLGLRRYLVLQGVFTIFLKCILIFLSKKFYLHYLLGKSLFGWFD